MALVLGFLLLPPVAQICGKRMLGVLYGIDGVLWVWRNYSRQTRCYSRQGSARLMLLLERMRLGSRMTYAAPEVRV